MYYYKRILMNILSHYLMKHLFDYKKKKKKLLKAINQKKWKKKKVTP